VSARKGAATDKTDAAATHRPIGQGVLDPGTGTPSLTTPISRHSTVRSPTSASL
jgi:hypothetical protein